MRRIVVLLILVGSFALGYYWYHARRAPIMQYEAFANEVLHRRYEAAAAMADGLSATDLEKLGSQERIGAGPSMFQTLFPSRFTIESQETGSDGVVTIHATQTVLFNPAGVESAVRPAMYATLKQVTRLKNGSGGWKVVEFENSFEKMDSLTSR